MNRPHTGSLSERRTGLLSERRLQRAQASWRPHRQGDHLLLATDERQRYRPGDRAHVIGGGGVGEEDENDIGSY